jgi:hypothetical protein
MMMFIQLYEDIELVRLRLELAALEGELARWEKLKAELERQIHSLNACYRLELSPLIQELLQLRQGQLAAQAEPQVEEIEDEAEEDLAEPLAPDAPGKLGPAEQKELKDLFRKACKRCHPDAVSGEFKEKARVIFIELKMAYEQNDLERVRDIWHGLAQGGLPGSRLPADRDVAGLRAASHYLRARIQAIQGEVEAMKRSAAYRRLSSVDDWDEYFDDLKAKLRREINRLKRRKRTEAAKVAV